MNNKLIGVFLVLIGGITAPQSAIDLKDGLTTQTATPITFAAFTAEPPTAGWFKLSGPQLEMTEALYVDDDGKVGNIYVPARKAGSELDTDSKAPITVLVRVSDAKSRQFIEKMEKILEKATDEALKFLTANSDQLQVQRTVKGTIADGFDALDDKDRRALEVSDAKLSDIRLQGTRKGRNLPNSLRLRAFAVNFL